MMNLYAVSLLLFSDFIIQISTTEQASTQKTKTRKSRQYESLYDECVCFPAGQSLFPELINPQGTGLERLVVYLFRDINTHQIKMFVPNPVKQVLIPNIPFEVGDVLRTITTETIASLFPTYLNVPDPTGTVELPIGMKWGTIQHSFNPMPQFMDMLPGYPLSGTQHVYPHQNYLPNPHHSNAQDLPNNYEIVNENLNSWLPKNPVQPLNPHQTNTRDIYTPKSKLPLGHLTFDQWFNQQMALFRDANSPQDIKTINSDVLRNLVQQTLFENHMHISSTGLITDANGAQIDLNHLELRPIMIGNPVSYQKSLIGDQLVLPKHLPYLEGLLVTILYPPKILGVIPLGKTYVAHNHQALPSSALIDHYYSNPAHNLASQSNYRNLYSTTTYPNERGVHSNPVPSAQPYQVNAVPNYDVTSKPPFPSMNLAFYAGGSVPLHRFNYLDPLIDGPWKRRSNLFSKKEKTPKPVENPNAAPNKSNKPEKAPSNANKKPKSKTRFSKKNHSPSTDGRKSGSRFSENWESASNPEWEVPSASQVTKPFDDQWSSNSNKFPGNTIYPYMWGPSSLVPSHRETSSHLNVHPIQEATNAGPGLIASPHTDPNMWRSSSLVPSHRETSSHFNGHPIQETTNASPGLIVSTHIDPNQNINPNMWGSSNLVPSHHEPSTHLNVQPIKETSNADPRLIASPHTDSNQNQYSSSYWTSQSIPNNSPYAKPIWNTYPNSKWESQDEIVNPSPSKSPFLRSDPGPTIKGTPTEIAYKIPPKAIVKPALTTPNTKYTYVTEGPKAINLIGTLNSGSFENQTSPTGGTRRFPLPMLQGVIKTLIQMVLQNIALSNMNKSSKTEPSAKELAVESNDHVNNIEKTGEAQGEGPDFRIIGGSAATGSGSPLNNKGRSGFNFG